MGTDMVFKQILAVSIMLFFLSISISCNGNGELGNERISRLVLMSPAAVLKDNALDDMMFGVRFDPDNIPEYITVFGHRVGRAYMYHSRHRRQYRTLFLWSPFQ